MNPITFFTKVPNEEIKYTVVIFERDGQVVPAIPFLRAPPQLVVGDRYIARKVIQHFGRALFRGETEQAERQRELLEQNYLRGRLTYRVVREVYHPLEKWRTGENAEESVLATFERSVDNVGGSQ